MMHEKCVTQAKKSTNKPLVLKYIRANTGMIWNIELNSTISLGIVFVSFLL